MPADPTHRIQVLSDHVCNKIAAGEVIERPASVFKELVENAVDAGADRIEVEVLQGGRKAVIVTDNGHGMDRESALLAIERHATSKIRDVDDIESIDTMGFRGEALAAISAVSRFLLITRRERDLSGTRVELDGGTLRNVEETGCPSGTRIEVRNLFFNVPARRKFLRTESTELGNIRALFQVFALAHPGITLILKVDGRELDRYPVQHRFEDRIADIHGGAILGSLKAIDYRQGDLHIHGFAGIPSLHRSDRRDQVTLVNRRPATAPVLGYAIREAYTDSLPRGRNPVVFLHLDMPPDWVDVNVHPTKREVRFGPATLIRDAVIHALSSSLRGEASTDPKPGVPHTSVSPPPETAPPRFHSDHRQSTLPEPAASPPPYPPLPPTLPPESRAPLPVSAGDGPTAPPPPPPPSTPSGDPPTPWKEAEVLGMVGDAFCLLRTEDGMMIMNPAAAGERILFERAKAQLEQGNVHSQPLLVPETIQCDPSETKHILERLEDLHALGFEVAAFGDNSFLIEAMPAWMGDCAPGQTVRELAMEVDPQAARLKTPRQQQERLARSCCYAAAQKRGRYSPEECKRLVTTLANCQMPYTTPFGRPTILHMGLRELQRKFGLDRV
ncbi:MAG: DNA mismatch repair endonuclease MutL [Kiritimatiellia bacterium]